MWRFDPFAVMVRLVLAAFFIGCASVVIGPEPQGIVRIAVGGLLMAIGIGFGAAAWIAFFRRG